MNALDIPPPAPPAIRRERCELPEGSIVYELCGAGPPLLMIMGYLARGSGWVTQREALASRFSVMTFDHLGVGDSEGLSPNSMSGFVEVCLALLRAAGWESAHVVGVSMGGMIAQHLALSAPAQVRSLSLIVTHAGGLSAVIPPLKGLPHFLTLQLTRVTLARHRALMRLLIPAERLARLDEAELLEQIARDFSPLPSRQVRLRQLRAVLGHRCARRLKQLTLPTLLVSADLDLLVSPRHQRRLSSYLPHAKLIRYPNAGHGLIRQPDLDLSEQLAAHIGSAELTWTGQGV